MTYIRCANCNRNNQISKTQLFQTHWYVMPYSCTGGDCWREGECQFLCKHCSYINRLLFKEEFDYKLLEYVSEVKNNFMQHIKPKFGNIKDTHDKDDMTKTNKWVNNFSLDKTKINKAISG